MKVLTGCLWTIKNKHTPSSKSIFYIVLINYSESTPVKTMRGELPLTTMFSHSIFSLGKQVRAAGRLLDAALTPFPLSLSYIERSPTIGTKAS